MSGKARILLLKDDTRVRSELTEILTDSGYHLDCTSSREDALQRMSESSYDLLITDMVIPDEKILKFISKVRFKQPEIAMVLLSSSKTESAAVKAMESLATDFIKEPYEKQEILDIIRINTMNIQELMEGMEPGDSKIRDSIFEFISNYPGIHFREIRDELRLGNGVLNYHLQVLKKKEMIKMEQDGINECYYPMLVEIPMEVKNGNSLLRESLIKMVHQNQGITPNELAQSLGISQQSINHLIESLEQSGNILVIKEGEDLRIWTHGR